MTASAVTIRRARLGPRWAAAAGRWALQRWLSDIDLARYGLPSQAIAIVRRLQAPAAALHDAHADPLATVFRGALRPAFEQRVGAGVSAVWFADEAELLACLARDALGGELTARWWWPLLFARTPTPALALQRWVAAPQAVPWALQALAAQRQGLAWLMHIGPAGRAELVQALVRAYPVCEAVLASVLVGDDAGGRRDAALRQDALRVEPGAESEVSATRVTMAAPASPDAALLVLRLAEVLRLAPQRAASPVLVEKLLAMAGMRQALSVGARAGTASAATPAAARGLGVMELPFEAGMEAASQDAVAVAVVASYPCAQAAAPLPAHGNGPPPEHRARRRRASTLRNLSAAPGPLCHTPALQPGASFHTGFGGVAFLLNVALHLGLYGDFSQPQHPGLPLSPWRLLHRAMRAACGRAGRNDPLAHWLLECGGRAPEPCLTAPWQLPGTALQAFEADARPWHAVVAAEWLQLWHPAGFCVAHRQPAAGLPLLLARLQRPQQPVCMHTARGPRPAPRLSALVWPLLRARLATALGLPARAAGALCLPLPAQVLARGERLDLHFKLASLPLAVRLAGLDRDPGWLPAAGSDIRFHFD